MVERNSNILYQHGTLAMLVPGLLAGTQSVDKLMRHGDTGIGTLAGLDGELIIRDGQVYQVNADGNVRVVRPNERIPFADVHYQHDHQVAQLDQLTYAQIKVALLDAMGTTNLFMAVRIVGRFTHVQTRAVRGHEKSPYQTLAATAKAQSVLNADNVMGTLSGYYSPALYGGATSPGFHLHFLDDDCQFGGHVLDVQLTNGQVYLQTFTDFQLHLPTTNTAFRDEQFDTQQVLQDINKAES